MGTPGIRRARSRLRSSSYAGEEGRARVSRKGIPASPEFQKGRTLRGGPAGRLGRGARRGAGEDVSELGRRSALWSSLGQASPRRLKVAGGSLGRAGSLILA